MMRNRLWYELIQAKMNENYSCLLIGYQRRLSQVFNILIALFSTGGIMGWKFWEYLPIVACAIISIISILKLVQPHIIPSDKQIDKLDQVSDFYFSFYLELEKLWFDFERSKIDEEQMQEKFLQLKQSERPINKIVNEIHKRTSKKLKQRAELETNNFFSRSFNT